jgi:hypothetical protein
MTLRQAETPMMREDDSLLAMRLELTGLTESEAHEPAKCDEKVARDRLRSHISHRVPCAPYN